MSYVYLLVSSDNATYVGATVDLNRRLRQHNKEIKQNVPIREKNGGTQAITGTGKADDQSNRIYRMAVTT